MRENKNSKQIKRDRKTAYTDIEIINKICDYFSISKDVVMSNTRKEPYITIRHICIFILYRLTGYSAAKVGTLFNKDHATVLNSIKRVNEFEFSHKELKNDTEFLLKKIEDPFYGKFKFIPSEIDLLELVKNISNEKRYV